VYDVFHRLYQTVWYQVVPRKTETQILESVLNLRTNKTRAVQPISNWKTFIFPKMQSFSK